MNKVCGALFFCFLVGFVVSEDLGSTFISRDDVAELLGEIGAKPLSNPQMSDVSLEEVINSIQKFEIEQQKQKDEAQKTCACHVFDAKKSVQGGLSVIERGIPVWAKTETNYGCPLPFSSLKDCNPSHDCTCSSRHQSRQVSSPTPTPSPSFDPLEPIFDDDDGLTNGELAAIIIASVMFAILATVFLFALATGAFAGGQVFTGTGPAMARDNPDA